MKWLDRYLQDQRIKKAKQYIPTGSRVLDIGSDDGILFKKVKNIGSGIGIEPKLEKEIVGDNFRVIKGYFPNDCAGQKFDVITLLAVLEHIPQNELEKFGYNCYDSLLPDGFVIITVPSPKVDVLLSLFQKINLIDGMSLEEHHGFKVADTTNIFSKDKFKLIEHKKFQCGLNNLFVFQVKN
ncbi:MAG: class I SAM-dependent methyltransferase [Ginsengibacter sp.]